MTSAAIWRVRASSVDESSEHILDRGDLTGPGGALGVVDVEAAGERGGRRVRESDLVADRTALHGDDRLEPVTPVRGGGQPEPPAAAGIAHGDLERPGREVVAFVDDHQAVPVEQRRSIRATGDRLQASRCR